ncbi:hypothetical protein BOTBODRAFT_620652 [Botryobasidium botryosum FD-172 SS1]|uniref:Tetraspanin Tsp2 family n=1 Tax=Botryobasidium botryosum (strain FD-172 SS1) TaxID=930990 RepID=A0A067LV20_BOTB1|nr:hypothetical protein BOTBODRAFT_620652 [Botryobasidium botryosum FD-172 SS1]
MNHQQAAGYDVDWEEETDVAESSEYPSDYASVLPTHYSATASDGPPSTIRLIPASSFLPAHPFSSYHRLPFSTSDYHQVHPYVPAVPSQPAASRPHKLRVVSPGIFNAISNTTANFTRKFPWSKKNGPFRKLEEDQSERGRECEECDSRIFGPIIEEGEDEGLGVESVRRWTIHKWVLMLSVSAMFLTALTGLLITVAIWFRAWERSAVVIVADRDVLILLTNATSILLFTSLLGLIGGLLNSRPILTFYNIFLWPAFISVLTVGYTAYRRHTFSLEGKLNESWSRRWDDLGRLIIQNTLHCCGFYTPIHEATFSTRCYPRTALPGCKAKLSRFERTSLRRFYSAAFAYVPVHILVIFVAVICSNHVNKTFGKGLTPRQYRLSFADVKANVRVLRANDDDVTRVPRAASGLSGRSAAKDTMQSARIGENRRRRA